MSGLDWVVNDVAGRLYYSIGSSHVQQEKQQLAVSAQ